MKSSNKRTAPSKPAASPAVTGAPAKTMHWVYLAGAFFLLLVLYEIYRPALAGPFLFDDVYLPFLVPNFAQNPLRDWIAGVRPTLQFTYWLNYRLFGLDPFPYHLTNFFMHMAAGFFVWAIARKLLALAGVEQTAQRIYALFAGAVFLLHPLQTESVSYIASRSEVLSGLFFLVAWAVFLYRKNAAIGFGETGLALVFFLLALTSKEHTAVLPAVLLLTDYCFNPPFGFSGIRKNWRLYLPMLAAALLGAVVIFRFVLGRATSAGFGMKDLTPLDYLFTQFRSLVSYLRLFFLPVEQNIDYDVPLSHSLWDHFSWLCLLILLGLTAAAWVYRKRFPLAFYGWVLFLLLLAPTSSFVPIRDVLIERRMYLPVFALSLCIVDFLRPRKISAVPLAAALGGACLVLGVVSWHRNQVWASAVDLWTDTVAQSPAKYRPRFQLAYAHYEKGECLEAMKQYGEAAKLAPPSYELLVDAALASDCANRPGEALSRLEEALRIENTAHAWALMGMVRGKQQDWENALKALAEAEKINPQFSSTYVYRGNIHMTRREWDLAIAAYARASELEPAEVAWRRNLENARASKKRAEARKATLPKADGK